MPSITTSSLGVTVTVWPLAVVTLARPPRRVTTRERSPATSTRKYPACAMVTAALGVSTSTV